MHRLAAPTKQDMKEAAKHEYRRKQEAERKCRIFHPRTRLIGIDRQALDQQVTEKQNRLHHEQELQRLYDLEHQRRINELNTQLRRLADERHRLEREMLEFRSRFQRKEQTREFDLNDPHYVRNASLSPGQSFLGEDVASLERQRMQRAQQRAWLRQQIHEQNQTKKNFEEANRALQAALDAHDARIREIDAAEMELRRQIQRNTAEYNVELAREQKAKRAQQKQQDDEDSLAEIINNLTSDMLTENKDSSCAASQFGMNRVIVTMYRGMTDEQIQEIRNEQRRQIEEKKLRVETENQMNAHFDEVLKSTSEVLENQERENSRLQRQLDYGQKMENEQLSRQQMQRMRHLNTNVYSFKPTEEYFNQFNTTTR